MSSSSSSESSSSAAAAADSALYGVRLYREEQSRYQVNLVDGFRLRVQARDARNMSPNIFRYRRGPGLEAGTEVDEFDGVASSVDLEEFPVGSPDQNAQFFVVNGYAIRYFRKDTIDLVFRSRTEAEDAWTVIVDEVDTLVRSLRIRDAMRDGGTVDVGYPADPGSGSSESSSSGA